MQFPPYPFFCNLEYYISIVVYFFRGVMIQNIINVFSLQQIISVSLILFAVIDIIGSIPIILKLEKKRGKIKPARAAIYATFIMLLFLFIGHLILQFFNLDIESFSIAGAIILFLIGMEMILNIEIFKSSTDGEDGTIVPLVFPLIAGPGTMTTLISLGAEFHKLNIVIGVLFNMIFVFMVLKYSDKIAKLLGPTGANILHKVFGLILLAMSIKLFKNQIQF